MSILVSATIGITNPQDKTEQIISQLTLPEKINLLSFQSPAIPRMGIAAYAWWNEGLHRVARAGEVTVFPQAIGMAASFDPTLFQKLISIVFLGFKEQ
jgi:beta-glucosidase